MFAFLRWLIISSASLEGSNIGYRPLVQLGPAVVLVALLGFSSQSNAFQNTHAFQNTQQQAFEDVLRFNLSSLEKSQVVSELLPTFQESSTVKAGELLNQDVFRSSNFKSSLREGMAAHWHRIHLSLDGSEDKPKRFYVVVKSMLIQHLDFYLFDDYGRLLNQRALGFLDIREFDGGSYNGPVFGFDVAPGQNLTLLIRKQTNGAAIFPVSLYTEEAYANYAAKRQLFIGGALLFMVVIALYNSFIGLLARSQSYIWYLAFYALTFLELSILSGFGYSIWPLAMHVWLASNLLVINFLLMATAFLFASKFLVAKLYTPGFYKYRRAILSLCVVGSVLSAILPEYVLLQPFLLFQLFGSLFILGMCVTAYRNGFQPARFFLLSWLCLLVGAAVGMSSYRNLVPLNDLTLNGLMIGALAELGILSFALVDRHLFSERSGIRKAYTDPQTRLPNYSFFRTRFAEAVDQSIGGHESLWLVMFRVKGVDAFTGLLGPAAAAKVYDQLVGRLNRYLDSSDWSVPIELPYGGDSYLVSMTGNQMLMLASTANHPSEFIGDFIAQASEPIVLDDLESRLSLDVGLAFYNTNRITLQEGYRQAQLALNNCELQNVRWFVYSRDQDRVNKERLELLADLREAINLRQLECYLQPQFDAELRLIGAEALVRWNHPTRGMVSPAVFVPLAEQSNQVFFITKIMIEKVCAWLSETPLPPVFHVSVNLSLLDLLEPGLLGFIEQCTHRYRIHPSQLVLEVTETAAMAGDENFVATIEVLHRMGFRVAMDDFGTGYSSLLHMQRMRPDMVKVDMGFVKNIHGSEINRKIVQAIVQIAHSTRASTVAEGVESEEELLTLSRLGVDYYQGYLTGKPIPSSEFQQTHFTNSKITTLVGQKAS